MVPEERVEPGTVVVTVVVLAPPVTVATEVLVTTEVAVPAVLTDVKPQQEHAEETRAGPMPRELVGLGTPGVQEALAAALLVVGMAEVIFMDDEDEVEAIFMDDEDEVEAGFIEDEDEELFKDDDEDELLAVLVVEVPWWQSSWTLTSRLETRPLVEGAV